MKCSGLSKLQKRILLGLFQDFRAAVPTGYPPDYLRWRTTGEPAVSASLSRAMRRLEARGLVLRQNYTSGMGGAYGGRLRQSQADPHNRTTHVQILPAGLEAAKWLLNVVAPFVNRLEADGP